MNLAYNLRLFKEIFFPRHCAVCDTEIDTGLICNKCRKHFYLDKILQAGANQESWQKVMTSGQPLIHEDVFDRIELLYRYDLVFKDALHSLKFENRGDLLPFLKEEAELALLPIVDSLARHYDLATFIPTSEERKKKRGFDVPQVIFSCLTKSFGENYTGRLIYRSRNTEPLYTMAAEERRNELSGCFAIFPKANIVGKRVLLCDDIFTTGSTMQEAAQLLLKAGAKSVGVLAFCASKDNWN